MPQDSLKVAVVSSSFPPMTSGGADYVFRLCQHLSGRNVEVHVITTERADLSDGSGAILHPVMRDWSWKELTTLLSTLNGIQPEVINLHYAGFLYNDHPMVTVLPSITKRTMPRARFVCFFESAIPARVYRHNRLVRGVHKMLSIGLAGKGFNYGFGTLLSDSDNIILLSKSHADELAAGWPDGREKMSVIPVPPMMVMTKGDPETVRKRERAKLGIRAGQRVISYLGYIYPGKGLETLIDAFAIVNEKIDAKLMLIGGTADVVLQSQNRQSYLDELRSRITERGITDSVIFTFGFETNSEVPSTALHASDIAVLPFDQGVHLNNSSYAAVAAHGLPIVTTAGTDTEAMYKHGENALLCPPQDPSALAEAVLALTRDQELRKRISRGAQQLAKKYMTWEYTTDQTLRVFCGQPPEGEVG